METQGTALIPSRQVLEETPGRVLSFLRTVGTFVPVAAILASRGYTSADHQEGWALLHQVSGYERPPSPGTQIKEVSDAIAELDAWDEPNFRIIEAALLHHYAEQAGFVFRDLAPATGAGAVLTVKTLLDRLDALENSPDRVATRDADHAALQHLAKRGYTLEEQKRLRALIKTAERGAEPADLPTGPVIPGGGAAGDAARRGDLEKLRAWYVEWSETARAVIKRRDYLIRLGLAKRKVAKKSKGKDTGGAPWKYQDDGTG
jgi:hypothetical protein